MRELKVLLTERPLDTTRLMFPCDGTATVNATPPTGPVPVDDDNKASLHNQDIHSNHTQVLIHGI
jgi:hypothetical protein